ncbi:hypothetical protein [Nonomuraea sp. GTA35]|uniref:hypothetical protein n=1 Tax=Nonomuraea sp. GTA35 TaxID=1676746 RepID=UPI0035BF65A0
MQPNRDEFLAQRTKELRQEIERIQQVAQELLTAQESHDALADQADAVQTSADTGNPMILGVLNAANAPTTLSSTASSALNVATTAPSAWAVTGQGPGAGVAGFATAPGAFAGVYAVSTYGAGCWSFSNQGSGVHAYSANGTGVTAQGVNGPGLLATSQNGTAILASTSSNSGAGVVADNASGSESGFAVIALGQSGVGLYASGTRASIQLRPTATNGPPASGFHETGEIMLDAQVDLYLCKASGTPGTWSRIG